MTTIIPAQILAIIYVRLSDVEHHLDEDGNSIGLEAHERRLRNLAAEQGWQIAHDVGRDGVIVENDMKPGKDGRIPTASASTTPPLQLPTRRSHSPTNR